MQTNKGLFTTSHYLSFKVRIPQLKTEVRRQDEDFDLLMKFLTQEYPHLIVPIIKLSKAQKQFAGKYINKRGVMLARFLRAVLRNRILRGDQFLMHFLTEPNEDQYKKARAIMQKREKVTKLEDFVTYSSVYDLTDEYVDNIQKHLWPKLVKAATQTEKGYVYLHEQIKRLALDIRVAGQTVENIRDAFQTLLRTSYHFQVSGTSEVRAEQEDVKFFLKCSMETFTDWGSQLQKIADFLQTDQSKFFQNIALEGERIGQMQRSITNILKEHDDGMRFLTKKQDDLWNAKEKDFSKWGNPDVMRMTANDQMQLLLDPRNKLLIEPEMQRELWRLR